VDFEWDIENPLARCKGETAKSNAALHDYAAMGSGRSIRALYAGYRQRLDGEAAAKPPSSRERTLFTWSERYAWQARVARYDELERTAEFAAIREAAIADRKKRIASLEQYRDHIIKALDKLDPADARHKDVTSALRMVTDELRTEYGDNVERHEISGPDGGPIEHREVNISDEERDRAISALADTLAAKLR